jgi:type IV pilus assembly protein PilC
MIKKIQFKRNPANLNLAVFMQQLAGMLQAGIPLTRCFEIIEQTHINLETRKLLYRIKMQLLAGNSLHDSLQLAPAWFDQFSYQLIQLGEQTGKLDSLLFMLAIHYEKRNKLKNTIKQALFYPCVILVTSLMLAAAMLIWVIPAFASLFQTSTAHLPLITRIIFAASTALNACLPVISLLMVLTFATMWLAHRRGQLGSILIKIGIALPPVQSCMQTLALIKFTRYLGMALCAGIPLLDALKLIANLVSHPQIANAIRQIRHAVTSGISIHNAMQPQSCFPILVRQMIKVGEESGTLDALLLKTADLLENEVDSRISAYTKLLEPLIMSVLGVLIGGLVIGMYLPVFNLGSTL